MLRDLNDISPELFGLTTHMMGALLSGAKAEVAAFVRTLRTLADAGSPVAVLAFWALFEAEVSACLLALSTRPVRAMTTITILLAFVTEVLHALRARRHTHAAPYRAEVGWASWIKFAVPWVRMIFIFGHSRFPARNCFFLVTMLVVLMHATSRISLASNHGLFANDTLFKLRLVLRSYVMSLMMSPRMRCMMRCFVMNIMLLLMV